MNEQNPNPICSHCGARMKEWWHSLTPGLLNILIKILLTVKEKGLNNVHIVREVGIKSHLELSNLSKLRHHGLIARVKDYTGQNIEGRYCITTRAGKFLRGELKIPKRVRTYRNEVVDHDFKNLVGINDFRNKIPYFESSFAWEAHDPISNQNGTLF